MSQHRIVGSEAFDRAPFVYIRKFHRRRSAARAWLVGAAAGALLMGGAGAAAWAAGLFG